jgi:menaquinone-dependent protoporphyrinogen oxidase
MKLLVVVASRHGATQGIADALAAELRAKGETVDIVDPAHAPTLVDYDAVVVGSAVYMGNWVSDAKHFLERNQAQLRKLPVWLFSSGPIGPHAPEAKDDPNHIAQLVQMLGARGHRTFSGKLDRGQLGLGERFVIWNVNRLVPGGVPNGDFRDWDAMRAWADEIAASVPAMLPSPGLLSTHSLPPCRSTIPRALARPRPVPAGPADEPPLTR